MTSTSSISTARYNVVLSDPTVRAAVRHFGCMEPRFDSREFITRLAVLPDFPSISIAELIAAARAASVQVFGANANWDEARELRTPFLTYLRRGEGIEGLDLVQIEALRPRTAVFTHDRFGTATTPLRTLRERWSGLILLTEPGGAMIEAPSEIDSYRAQVSIKPDVLTREECANLISYCEDACFSRSRVAQRQGEEVSAIISRKTRSSSSVVLHNRSHPLLARLYRQCAVLEGAAESEIEAIQCVRYKRGQQFRAHFDGGIDLPRLTTFLIYLNDDFDGGETYFPMLDYSVRPVAGSWLRFPSCSINGEILWASEHGGLPVTNGVKYALNIWVRCPAAAIGARHGIPAAA